MTVDIPYVTPDDVRRDRGLEPQDIETAFEIVRWAAKEGYIKLAHKHKMKMVGSGLIFLHFDCQMCPFQKNIPRGFLQLLLLRKPTWRPQYEEWLNGTSS